VKFKNVQWRKCRKKPIEVEFFIASNDMDIETLNGIVKADKGEIIMRGVNGEIYPCKPDIFEKTYEVID